MQLAPPPGWTVERRGQAATLVAPVPGLVVHAAPMVPRGTLDLPSVIGRDRPPLSRLEVLQTLELATDVGWRMQLITASVIDAAGPRETRLAAIYDVIHWNAVVLAIGSDAAVYDAHREAVVQMLVAARPHLSHAEPVCVKHLWEMEPR